MGISSFLAPLQKRSIFLLFVPLLFLLFWIIYRKRKQKRKSLFLGCFCSKTSVFVANNILIFSNLRLYRANHTPPHPFLALAGWVSSLPKFFIFYFFCKILWFYQFRFSTEFWAFSRTSYLLLILHKFSRYLFSLIFVRYGAFYVALRYSLSPSYFERLRIQFSSYFRFCGKIRLFSDLRFFFDIYGLQFR